MFNMATLNRNLMHNCRRYAGL